MRARIRRRSFCSCSSRAAVQEPGHRPGAAHTSVKSGRCIEHHVRGSGPVAEHEHAAGGCGARAEAGARHAAAANNGARPIPPGRGGHLSAATAIWLMQARILSLSGGMAVRPWKPRGFGMRALASFAERGAPSGRLRDASRPPCLRLLAALCVRGRAISSVLPAALRAAIGARAWHSGAQPRSMFSFPDRPPLGASEFDHGEAPSWHRSSLRVGADSPRAIAVVSTSRVDHRVVRHHDRVGTAHTSISTQYFMPGFSRRSHCRAESN